jgi:hypothetical protein
LLLLQSGLLWLGQTGVLRAALTTELSPECQKLKDAWDDKYFDGIRADWDKKEFSCTGPVARLAETLTDLDTLAFAPTPSGYAPDFYAMVTRNLKTTHYDDGCTMLALGTRADGLITICPPFFEDSREDRASTLVHESRHLESSDPGHVDCVGGRFGGAKQACDDTFYGGQYEGSGYNADVFFLSWVLKGAKQNTLRQSVLQGLIDYYVPDRFNHVTVEQMRKWRGGGVGK